MFGTTAQAQDTRFGGGALPATQFLDGGFEQATFDSGNSMYISPAWESFGANAICHTSVDACTVAGSSGPYEGSYWLHVGGPAGIALQDVRQHVVLPDTGSTLTLSFMLWVSTVDPSSLPLLAIFIDDVTPNIYGNSFPATHGWQQVNVDLSSYADGQVHTIRFYYSHMLGTGHTHASIDNITLNKGDAMPLLNTGFESGADGWTQTGKSGDKAKCNTDTKTFSYQGNCAFVFAGSAAENSVLKQTVALSARVLPPAGQRVPLDVAVYLGAFVYSKSSAKGNLKYVATVQSGEKLKGKVSLKGANTYVWKQTPPQTFETTDPLVKMQIVITHTSTSGKVYIDDVEMYTGVA